MNDVKLMPPQKTWFFERNGKPFAVNEKEAWELVSNKSNWRDQTITMIGMSDGTTFHEIVKNSKTRTRELTEQIRPLKEKLNKYIAAHDRLLFEEFLEETDPRILRAKNMIGQTESELEPLEKELEGLKSNIIEKAFNAELEKARGNKVMPQNFDVRVKAERGHENLAEQFKRSKGA